MRAFVLGAIGGLFFWLVFLTLILSTGGHP